MQGLQQRQLPWHRERMHMRLLRFCTVIGLIRASVGPVIRSSCSPNASCGTSSIRHSRRQQRRIYCQGVALSAGEVVNDRGLVLNSYDEELFEPSRDLRELASAQLQSMFQVLSRISPTQTHSWRACVYARRADSLESPQIQLQRVACWPSRIRQPAAAWSQAAAAGAAEQPGFSASSSSGGAASFEEMDDLLILHRPAWEGGSSNSSAACDAEASLVQEEVVLLPSSNMLVLPLAEAGVLVGLLVVEVPGVIHLPSAAVADGSTAAFGSDSSKVSSSGSVNEDALWCLRMSVPPLAKACAMDLRTALAGAQQEAQQRLARSLLTEARGPLKVLGTFGAMLAPRLRADRGSQPESDMADGMVMQGQRLADVVAQLEAALRPAAAAAVRGEGRQQLALSVEAVGAAGVWEQPALVDGYDDVGAVQLPGSISQTQQLHQQQQLQEQQQPKFVPVQGAKGRITGAASPEAGYLIAQSSSSSASTSSKSSPDCEALTDAQEQQQQQQQQTPHIPGQWVQPAGLLQSSSRDIRWSSVQPTTAARRCHPSDSDVASSSSSTASSSGGGPCSAFYSAATAGGVLDVQKTIDLEPITEQGTALQVQDTGIDSSASSWGSSSSSDPASLNSSGSGSRTLRCVAPEAITSSSSSKLSRRQQKQQSTQTAPQQQVYCNLVDALSHLLTAAARLAQMQGVNFIVNHPLQLDQPVGQPVGQTSHGSSNSSAAAVGSVVPSAAVAATAVGANTTTRAVPTSSSAASAASEECVLLPRPIRPLLVGLAAGTCRRVLSYVLDVALQCTPRGGQLCVTARQCSGGVEVNVLHTGQAQASRLHTSSQAFATAVHSNSSSGSCKGMYQASSSTAASSSRAGGVIVRSSSGSTAVSSTRSRAMQELASSSGLRSGSSLVSLDFASQVLKSIGGRLSVVYPCHFMNAISGQLEVGSSIEVWLPPPSAAA